MLWVWSKSTQKFCQVLETKSHHDANFVVIESTVRCLYDKVGIMMTLSFIETILQVLHQATMSQSQIQ